MKNKFIWIGVVVILIAVISFGFINNNNGSVKIVALYPLTGGVASWGESSQKGMEMAVAEINNAGGINGRPLEVIYADHKCDAKTALSAFEQYLPQSKIFTSSSCSGTVLSLAPKMQSTDSVLLATVVASVKISNVSPAVFRNWAVENRQSAIVAGKIKELGLKKVGVIYEETDYAKGLEIALEKNLENSGVTIIAESFTTGATDVRTQLAKLKAAKVEAIFVSPQTETSSEVILSQMEQLNFKTKMFVNDIVFGAPNLIAKHTAILEGAFGGNFVISNDKLDKFLVDYKAIYGTDCAHVSACAVAYDSGKILAEAINANGNTASGVKSYLKTLNYTGVSGITKFDSNNDRDGVGYSLSTITDGKVVLVK